MLFRNTSLIWLDWVDFLFSKELVCLRLMVNLHLIDIPQLEWLANSQHLKTA